MLLSVGWSFLETFFWSFLVLILYPLDPTGTRFRWRLVRVWGRRMIKVARLTYVRKGPAFAPGPSVFTCNHLSAYDIPILAAEIDRPFRFIAKYSIQYLPILGWAMKSMHFSFMKRDRSQRDINELRKFTEKLRRDGASMIVFPEGTRTKTGELLPFKKGPFHVAKVAGLQVAPCCVHETDNVKRNRNFVFQFPARASFSAGPVISQGEVAQLQVEALMIKAREMTLKQQAELRAAERGNA
jgi:1-acyl-sn-glycerol-3-phosphate acyltransferase